MPTITKIYSKKFSTINDFQNEKMINYSLIEDDDNMYGIEISIEENGKMISDREKRLFNSKKSAGEFVQFLYENSIQIDSWRDIAKDILGIQTIYIH